MSSEKQHSQDDDIISHYGSMSGETFASRRSRRGCSHRLRSIDVLASNLKEHLAKEEAANILAGVKLEPDGSAGRVPVARCNSSFHHFRILIVMMGGMSVGLMMLMRYSITVAILRMVNQTHLYLEEHPDRTVEDFLDEGYSLGGEFNWNNEIIAIMLSWYMFSYTLPQMPSSRLAAKIGCRFSVPISLSICAISLLLTPTFAYRGWHYVVVLRLLNGLGASPVLPMLLSLVEIWIRYDELSFGLSMAQILTSSFISLTPLISGYLTEIHWSYAFYVPAILSLLFCLVWLALVSDGPDSSRFISEKELLYIRDVAGEPEPAPSTELERRSQSIADNKMVIAQEDESAHKPDSWLQILRVPSFYAYVAIWCLYCSSYSEFTFLLPTYMRQFLKIRVAQNGFYCFLIQCGCIIAVLWPHPLLRMLQNMGLSVTRSRAVAYAVACSMVAASWFYVGAFHDIQLIMLFVGRCFHNGNDIIVTGSLMSNYARAGMSGLAFSLVNTVGNLSIVAFSTLVGWMLDRTGQSREAWSWIFAALGSFQILMFIVFALFIDSEPIKFKNKRQQDVAKAVHQIDLEQNQKQKREYKSDKCDLEKRPKN